MKVAFFSRAQAFIGQSLRAAGPLMLHFLRHHLLSLASWRAALLWLGNLLLWPWRKAKAAYIRRQRYSHSLLGRRAFVPPQIIFIPLFFVAFFMGAVISLDWPLLVLVLSAAIFAMMVFVMADTKVMLLILFVLTFVVQGSAMYFGNITKAPWIAVGMAGLFFLRALLELTTHNRKVSKAPQSNEGVSVIVALSVYLACYFCSFLVNRPPLGQFIVSMKANLPIIGVLLALYWFNWTTPHLARLWKLLLWIGVIQFPVIVYQHFVIAPRRLQGFDSVVGTFGGQQGAGGLSSVMVFFILASFGYAAARWNRKLLSARYMILYTGIIFLNILLGEVKAAFVWWPIVTIIVLRKRILKNVLTLVGYVAAGTVLLLAIYSAYNVMYWTNLKGNEGTISEKLNRTGGYFFDTRQVDYKTGEVSRGASIAFWATDRAATVPRRIIGYGPGASRSGGISGKGEIARRFEPLAIDATTIAVMLWDVGILGFASYTMLFVMGLLIALRFLWRGRGSAEQQAMMEAAFATLAILISMLIYNRTLTDEPTMQLFFFFVLGTIIQIARYPDQSEPKTEVEKQPGKPKPYVQARPLRAPLPARRPPVVYPNSRG